MIRFQRRDVGGTLGNFSPISANGHHMPDNTIPSSPCFRDPGLTSLERNGDLAD